jgi:hypothetical protein
MTKVTAQLPDAKRVADDLQALMRGLSGEIADARRAAIPAVAAGAAALAPVGPGPRLHAKNPNDQLPHLRDTITAGRGGVIARHPAGKVFEFGGVIAPHGAPIRIRKVAMAARAGAQLLPAIEADLKRRLTALLLRTLH